MFLYQGWYLHKELSSLGRFFVFLFCFVFIYFVFYIRLSSAFDFSMSKDFFINKEFPRANFVKCAM